MTAASSSQVLDQACAIIADNLGANTAKAYRASFSGEEPAEIVLSLEDLLKHLVGPANANKQLATIRQLTKKR